MTLSSSKVRYFSLAMLLMVLVHHQAQGLVDIVDAGTACGFIFGIDAKQAACLVDGELFNNFCGTLMLKSASVFFNISPRLLRSLAVKPLKGKLAADIDITIRHGKFEGFDVQNRIVSKQARSLVFGRLNQGSLNFFFAHFLHGHFGNFVFQCQSDAASKCSAATLMSRGPYLSSP